MKTRKADFEFVSVTLNSHSLNSSVVRENLTKSPEFKIAKERGDTLELDTRTGKIIVEEDRFTVVSISQTEVCKIAKSFVSTNGAQVSGLVGLGFASKITVGNTDKFQELIPLIFPEYSMLKWPVTEGSRIITMDNDQDERRIRLIVEWDTREAKGYFWLMCDTFIRRPAIRKNYEEILQKEEVEYSVMLGDILQQYGVEGMIKWKS